MFPSDDDDYNPDIHITNLQHISRDVIEEVATFARDVKNHLITDKMRSVAAEEIRKSGVLKKVEAHDATLNEIRDILNRVSGLFAKANKR